MPYTENTYFRRVKVEGGRVFHPFFKKDRTLSSSGLTYLLCKKGKREEPNRTVQNQTQETFQADEHLPQATLWVSCKIKNRIIQSVLSKQVNKPGWLMESKRFIKASMWYLCSSHQSNLMFHSGQYPERMKDTFLEPQMVQKLLNHHIFMLNILLLLMTDWSTATWTHTPVSLSPLDTTPLLGFKQQKQAGDRTNMELTSRAQLVLLITSPTFCLCIKTKSSLGQRLLLILFAH